MTLFSTLHPGPDSVVARLDPRWKLAALLPAACLVAVLQRPLPVGTALIGSLALLACARLPWRWSAARLGSVFLFLALFVVWLPFVPAVGEESIQVLSLSVWPIGLERAAVILGKGLTLTALFLVLFASGPLPDTLKAAHALYVPGVVVHVTLLTYRYVFLLAEEFVRLRTALRVRGFRNRANLHSYRTIGQVAGTLLVRGHERGERVGQAMRCRGFDGRFRSLHEFRTGWREVALSFLVLGTAVAILVWDLLTA